MALWLQIISLVFALSAMAAVGMVIYFSKDRIENLEERVHEIESEVNELEVQNMLSSGGSDEDEKVFEDNMEDLAEDLFKLLKQKHDFEDITTMTELLEKLRNLEVEDEELLEELISFFETVIKTKYSNESLDSEERKEIKEAAKDLIRRTGQFQ